MPLNENQIITFKKASFEHQDILFKWLDERHVKDFWENSQEHQKDIIHFYSNISCVGTGLLRFTRNTERFHHISATARQDPPPTSKIARLEQYYNYFPHIFLFFSLCRRFS